MVEITVLKKACRGCRFCSDDVCPTNVFEYDDGEKTAVAKTVEDCIACLSCVYICPSNAIKIRNHHEVQNFYRELDFAERLEKYI